MSDETFLSRAVPPTPDAERLYQKVTQRDAVRALRPARGDDLQLGAVDHDVADALQIARARILRRLARRGVLCVGDGRDLLRERGASRRRMDHLSTRGLLFFEQPESATCGRCTDRRPVWAGAEGAPRLSPVWAGLFRAVFWR